MFKKNVIYSLIFIYFLFRSIVLQAQFLLPQDAFKFKAYQVTSMQESNLHVVFEIANNHFLYKEKFEFFIDDANVKLGKPIFPLALSKFDSNFNKRIDFYKKSVKIILPIVYANNPFTLKVVAQGCAENSVCYPPTAYYQHIIPKTIRQPITNNAIASSGKLNASIKRPAFSFLNNVPYKSAGLPLLTENKISVNRNQHNYYTNNLNNQDENIKIVKKADHSKSYWLFIFICIICTSIISHPMFNQEE
jgi:thiol:disulfide interchange protein